MYGIVFEVLPPIVVGWLGEEDVAADENTLTERALLWAEAFVKAVI